MANSNTRYPNLASSCRLSMREHTYSYVDAPWFDVDGIRNPEMWREDLNADKELPGGNNERVLESYEWRQRVVITSED